MFSMSSYSFTAHFIIQLLLLLIKKLLNIIIPFFNKFLKFQKWEKKTIPWAPIASTLTYHRSARGPHALKSPTDVSWETGPGASVHLTAYVRPLGALHLDRSVGGNERLDENAQFHVGYRNV